MIELLEYSWSVVYLAFAVVIATVATVHAILNKRETRTVIAWTAVIWLGFPVVTSLLYFAFGVNRLRRRGGELQRRLDKAFAVPDVEIPAEIRQQLEQARVRYPRFAQMVDLVRNLTDQPLLPGNRVEPLLNGDQAYPAMLDAIHGARHSISLVTYIFDHDRSGQAFIDALSSARERGVEVRVLIDDVGARYSRTSVVGELCRRGVDCRTFLPTRVPRSVQYANLRNHRKLLTVDGQVAFTGSLNIREGCMLEQQPEYPVQDIHFRLAGPVVTQMQRAFIADWAFASGEVLQGEPWLPQVGFLGDSWARGIPDGPDEDFEKLLLTLLGAIGVAQQRLVIMTPYFLPDSSIVNALSVAALRGVQVDIILPEVNNLRLVQWASTAMLWQVLIRGCRVYLTPPPFDHSKLMLVDNAYAMFGSTNWDPRSLRLNFEYNVECYSSSLCEQLSQVVEDRIAKAKVLTLNDVDSRSLAIKLRDGFARLLTPYL